MCSRIVRSPRSCTRSMRSAPPISARTSSRRRRSSSTGSGTPPVYDRRVAVILITGATDGLGRGLANALADRGHTVLVHGRSQERIDDTLAELGREGHRGYRADLSSLAEVRALATEVSEAEERLEVLVNNAGIGFGGERQESADGIELRFAVNYLAGYLLTNELLALLERSAPARIVNVSSAGQQPIDF